MQVDQEHKNIEVFVEYLMSDDQTMFQLSDVEQIAFALRRNQSTIIAELKSYGLAMVPRTPPKAVRGFTTNNHDRWYGPGAARSYGGSGHEQIAGWAGQQEKVQGKKK